MRGWNTRGDGEIPPERARRLWRAAHARRPAATRRRRLRQAADQTAKRQLQEQPGKRSPLSVRLEVKRHEQGALNSRMDSDLRLLGLVAGDVTDLGPPIDEAAEWVERARERREEAEQQLESVSEGRRKAAMQLQQAAVRLRQRVRAENLVGNPTVVAGRPPAPSQERVVPEQPVREENLVGQADGLSPADMEAIGHLLTNRLRGAPRRALLSPVVERLLLVGSALGEFGLNYVAAQVMALPARASIAFTVSVSIASIMLAVTVGRIIDRLPEGPDGGERFRLRQVADIAVVLLAVASGVGIAIAIAFLRESYLDAVYTIGADSAALARDVPPINQNFLPWLRWLALGLLGLAVAVAYAGAPAQREQRHHPWRALGGWLQDRIRRRSIVREARRGAKEDLAIANESLKFEDQRLAEARERLRAVEQQLRQATRQRERLREELERRGSSLLGIEQAVLRGWSHQAAVGDAACHQLDRFLAQALVHHRKGLRDRLLSWWRGRPWDQHEEFEPLERTAYDANTWEEQVGRITQRAKDLLAKHGVVSSDLFRS